MSTEIRVWIKSLLGEATRYIGAKKSLCQECIEVLLLPNLLLLLIILGLLHILWRVLVVEYIVDHLKIICSSLGDESVSHLVWDISLRCNWLVERLVLLLSLFSMVESVLMLVGVELEDVVVGVYLLLIHLVREFIKEEWYRLLLGPTLLPYLGIWVFTKRVLWQLENPISHSRTVGHIGCGGLDLCLVAMHCKF